MELFETIKRPRAEMKVINAIIPLLELSIKKYKSNQYQSCITDLVECKRMLIPIYDITPKCKVSYYLYKSYYKNCQYQHCKDEINEVIQYIDQIDKDSLLYIKSKVKIYLYQTISNLVLNNKKESVSNIINTIEYIKQSQFTVANRARMFWIFIKGFLGEASLNKTKQWEQFKEYYAKMEQEAEDEGRINNMIKDVFKQLMSTKTRKALFDYFNNSFFLHKYGLPPDNKVISFLEKNLIDCVRENNLVKLKLKVEGYLHLAKLKYQDYFPNVSLADLLTEQKFRVLNFDIIFGNLCGGFSAIFKEYFIENEDSFDKIRQLMMNNNNVDDGNDDEELIYNEKDDLLLCDSIDEKAFHEHMKTESVIKRTSDTNVLIKSAKTNLFKQATIKYKLSRNDVLIKKSSTVYNPDFNFAKDVTIPPNIHIENDVFVVKFKPTTTKSTNQTIPYRKLSKNRLGQTNRPRQSQGQVMLHFPAIKTMNLPSSTSQPLKNINSTSDDNIDKATNKNDSFIIASNTFNRDKKLVLAQIQPQVTTQNSANVTTRPKESPIILRNINNFLFTTLINHFSSLPLLKKNDMSPIRIHNYVKSYFASTEKNSQPTIMSENQDASYTYENFLLIKNFYCFGVCDGHGKNGKLIAEAVSVLFPSYLFYLIIDNNLMKRHESLNEIVISLFKMEEKPEVKDMNILKYFLLKLELDYSKVSFVKEALPLIRNEIIEAIARTNDDCKNRKKIDAETSGCTLCSVFIYNKVLYAVNVGDSRAVLGSQIYDENRWVTKELTFDHKPDDVIEAKRIALSGGRIAQMKNEQGIEVGPYRVWFKNPEAISPGLALSRTIGDYQAKKIGVTYEPNIYEYHLNVIDKIIIIATDGLWENITNEEAIAFCAEYYENKKRAEEASNELIHKVKAIKNKKNKPYDDITCVIIFLDVKE